MKWTLKGFLHGDDFASRYARLCLPVLVSRAEQYRGIAESEVPDFTYGDLAVIVAGREYAHPMHFALGSIGYTLQELNTTPEWSSREIPPVQLMVWTAGKGSPGDDAFSFIGISKKQIATMPTAARKATARSVRATILAYPYWRDVLAALNLIPLTLELPTINVVNAAADHDWGSGGESIHHKRLKQFLAEHYELLGLECGFRPSFEVCLPSADRIDLVLENRTNSQLVCVEVKSRISVNEDLIRGLFQCIKYRAVLDAQERYELQRSPGHRLRTIRVLLVTECRLSTSLTALADFLGVEVCTVLVPEEYEAKKHIGGRGCL